MKCKITVLLCIVAPFLAQSAMARVSATAAAQGKREEVEPWNPSWQVQTSPIGDIAKRFNLEASHFFAPEVAVGVKGTRMVKATQTVFGSDDGYEVGARGSYYFFSRLSGRLRLGSALGLYYANFRRGDNLGDAIGSMLEITTVDRDEVNGLMVEGLASFLFAANSWLTFESMAGLQAYGTSYFTYNTASGTRTERKPSSWNAYLVLELNVGIAF